MCHILCNGELDPAKFKKNYLAMETEFTKPAVALFIFFISAKANQIYELFIFFRFRQGKPGIIRRSCESAEHRGACRIPLGFLFLD